MKPAPGWVYASVAFFGGYLLGTALWLAPKGVAIGAAIGCAAFVLCRSLRASARE